MRVPVKLLGFGFWLFFLNCAQCQECLREDIIYENTELVAKASYTDGETVKVNCMTGYIGSYKLKCENGQWKKMVGRSCAKKKCNHPGDTPNGDFKLTDGMEFVFGVTVVYTCNTGYEMASRINQRTCRSQGWDNAVPVCEVVKCPVIRTDGNVTASGNTEEGSYGDVIHFECVSSDKKIDGSSDIHCEETGKWSDVVPKCKDITCAVPVISNGHIDEPLPEYQKNAILKYKCNPRFKPREGIPKCTKFGWTLNPECDEVTCDLKSTTFGIKNINPQGKTIFRAGERVEITCSEKYWLFLTRETSKSFICKDNGKWDHEPVCEEIKCEVPHDQHVNSPEYYFSGDKKLGKKINYYCKSGYEKMAEKATCTQDGWTPKPLCAEKMCTAPDIKNAEIVGSQQPNYRINSKIQYKCSPGFEPEQSVQITCNSQAQWTVIKQCTEKMCIAPNIPNAEIVGGQQQNYRINSRIKYKCSPGFEPEQPVQITCSSQGQWTEIQQCTEMQKCLNLHLENGFIYSQSSNKEETIYSCNTGYKPFTGNWWDSVTCSKGSWSDEPRCIREEECGALPSVHHGKLKQTKQTFHDGNTTIFECDPGFISTHRFIKCINGTWETPVCKVGVRCDIPPKVKNAVITTKPEELYVDGSNVTYKCQSSFLIIGNSTVFCCNGTWEETPTCEEEVHCEIPPNVENAVITSKPQEFYLDGSNVTYMCQSSFLMSGKITVFCRNGTWEETPKCEAKCHRPHENFMRLVNEKDVYDNKEILKYNCIEPYNEIPEGQLICENGKWSGNFVCTNPICPPPPYVENGDYNKRYQQEIVITMVYYTCQPYYVLNEQKQYYKCDNGKWETPPKCLKPCEITPEIREAHDLQNKREKSYLRHGESQDFYCKYRQNIGWTRASITCSDGKLNVEPCKKYK